MAEPFKNLFNSVVIQNMALHLSRVDTAFDARGFVAKACEGLEHLELKARSNHICDALEEHLPDTFPRAAKVLINSLHPDRSLPLAKHGPSDKGIQGWAIMPMAEYAARHGLDDFELGMQTLRELTCRFTAEFAIRAYILHDPKRSFAMLKLFAKDDNFHVRRLASEGARPRLPWGQQLPSLIANPTPLWPILSTLKHDSHEYVRKSVANHLNDIAKDHPEKVNDFVAKWLPSADVKLQKLLKHGSRTLLKNGNPKTLALFGFKPVKIAIDAASLNSEKVSIGEELELTVTIKSLAKKDQAIMLDYLVYYQKANGTLSPKVFKWKSFVLAAGDTVYLKKKHSFKRVTTRAYHTGDHAVAIQINGKEHYRLPFVLDT